LVNKASPKQYGVAHSNKFEGGSDVEW
jgi:hypothetical protein